MSSPYVRIVTLRISSATLWANAPSANAKRPVPATHAASDGSSPRRAACAGEPRRPVRDRAVARRESTLAPRSRLRATSTATAARSGAAAANRSRTAGRAPVTGRTCSTHPMGEIQRTQPMPWPMSAAMRKKTATASASPPRPGRRAAWARAGRRALRRRRIRRPARRWPRRPSPTGQPSCRRSRRRRRAGRPRAARTGPQHSSARAARTATTVPPRPIAPARISS